VAALAIDAERAGQGLRDDVEGRLVAQRPGQPKAADRAINQARIDLRQLVIAEAEPVHKPRAGNFSTRMSAVATSRRKDLGAGRLLQIDDEAFSCCG